MQQDQHNTALPGPGLGFTFLYYFSMTTLIMAFVTAQSLGFSLTSPQPYRLGLLVGLLAGAIGTYFNRTVSFDTAFKNQTQFITNLNQVLTEMGFEPDPTEQERSAESAEEYLVYQRTGWASMFSGRVFVKLKPKTAQVFSRAANIRKLQRRL